MRFLARPTVLIFILATTLVVAFQNCGKSFEAQKVATSQSAKNPVLVGKELPKNFMRIRHLSVSNPAPVPAPLVDRPDSASMVFDLLAQPITVEFNVVNHDMNSTGGVVTTRCEMTLRLTGEAEQRFFGALMVLRYGQLEWGDLPMPQGSIASRSTDFLYNNEPPNPETPDNILSLHSGKGIGSYTGFTNGKNEFLSAIQLFLESEDLTACPANYRDLFRDL